MRRRWSHGGAVAGRSDSTPIFAAELSVANFRKSLQSFPMNIADDGRAAREHLIAIWETILSERDRSLARVVEGVIAELSDDPPILLDHVKTAANAWFSLFKNPRGLSEFHVWHDDYEQRVKLNQAYDRHVDAVHRLLRPYGR